MQKKRCICFQRNIGCAERFACFDSASLRYARNLPLRGIASLVFKETSATPSASLVLTLLRFATQETCHFVASLRLFSKKHFATQKRFACFGLLKRNGKVYMQNKCNAFCEAKSLCEMDEIISMELKVS